MVKKNRPLFLVGYALLLTIVLGLYTTLLAGDPHSAYYSSDTNKILWFIHASDTHIGARGTTDSTNLQWLVGQARTAINPSFIVVTGDLTDSTNGNLLGIPNGPYQAEWDQYKNILSSNGVEASFYYDIPGNHDAYNDQHFNYYLANSVQGRATGRTQASWTRLGPWGKYHFLGVNTADNTGAPFSVSWPYGDNAGLDSSELSFIGSEMTTHGDAALTLIFGHHPLAPTGNSSDTYLFYGKDEFVGFMDSHGASLYGYGHTHVSSEQFFTQNMNPGVFYFNVSALGKDSPNQYTVTAIDCNGISSVTQTVNTWPVVLITTPMNRRLGGIVNPYAYTVPKGASNPIRALVFDPNGITQVQFRINGGVWQPMTSVPGNPNLWQGVWNASTLPGGEHTVDVQATTGSGVRMDTVATYLTVSRTGDFDGDRGKDMAVWRPGDGMWYILRSSDGGVTCTQWGTGTLFGKSDVPVPGDYDGDGKTDMAVWRPGDGRWYILRSSDGGVTTTQWGAASLNDVPVPGDYDGDGRTDMAVWRPGDGMWYILRSSDGGVTTTQWGAGSLNDVPVPGDYDGDGRTDMAVWRPGDGMWYIKRSSDGGVTATQWGTGTLFTKSDIPVPGDYDGDGRTDMAVWRSGDGMWYIRRSSDGGVTATQWGTGTLFTKSDVPVPGDYDGDGKTDIAVWRPGDGMWYIKRSSDGGVTATQWGAGDLNDLPIAENTLIYRYVEGSLY